MRYNTLKELQDVMTVLWEIDDILNGESSTAVREAIQAVQKAWNVVKKEKGVKSSYIPIKSMAAVSRGNRMDFKSLQAALETLLSKNGVIYKGTKDGVHIKEFGDIIIKAAPTGDMNRSTGRYSIELVPDGDEYDSFLMFDGGTENDYYEGTSAQEFREDCEDILRQIFDIGRTFPQMARDMWEDVKDDYMNDPDNTYEEDDYEKWFIDGFPHLKHFFE